MAVLRLRSAAFATFLPLAGYVFDGSLCSSLWCCKWRFSDCSCSLGVNFRPQAGTVRMSQHKRIGMRDYYLCLAPARICMCVKRSGDDEIVRDGGGRWARVALSLSLLFIFFFFASHHLPPRLIYTHTHPNLWSGEQNRDGRWSRTLSELLAAHLLQSRQQDTSHRGPNSPDLYLAITHFLPCRHANCLSDHLAF